MKLLRAEVGEEERVKGVEEEADEEDDEDEEEEEEEEEHESMSSNTTPVLMTVQLQVIQLLHVLLPNWDRSLERQKEILQQLFDILAEHTLLSKPDFILETAHAKRNSSLAGKNSQESQKSHKSQPIENSGNKLFLFDVFKTDAA